MLLHMKHDNVGVLVTWNGGSVCYDVITDNWAARRVHFSIKL